MITKALNPAPKLTHNLMIQLLHKALISQKAVLQMKVGVN